MKEAKTNVDIGVKKIYEAFDFVIAPSLAGCFHEFVFNGYSITFQLPKKPKKKDEENWRASIYCQHWKSNKPYSYKINNVFAYLDVKKSSTVKKIALVNVNSTLFNKRERSRFNIILNKHDQIIDNAFEYWVNLLRWKSGIYSLGQTRFNERKSNWSTYLYDTHSNKSFYSSIHHIVISPESMITKKIWRQTQTALSQNIQTPIWQIYIADANQKNNIGDTREFIIDLAIAIETIVRQILRKHIAKPTNPEFEKLVGRMPVRQIIDSWYKLGFNTPTWRKLSNSKKLITDLIDKRNTIMHCGKIPSIDKEYANKLNKAVIEFIKKGEQEILL